MPRREVPEDTSLKVGQRIRQLRKEAGLTLEKLAYEGELLSKGHLSDIENGLVSPSVATLALIAEGLSVDLLDLVTFPEESNRQFFVDVTRSMSEDELKTLLNTYT